MTLNKAIHAFAVVMSLGGTVFVAPVATEQPQPSRDPIIGTWVLNVAKSKYVTGVPPKSIVRKFDYTRDGMILVTLESVNAQGVASSNHWYMALDGKEHPEFSRARGAEPILWIAINAVDSHTKDLIGRRIENGAMTVVDLMRFAVGKDGQTMTITYTDPKSRSVGNVVFYDKHS